MIGEGVVLVLMHGVEGPSVYLNGHRIAGPKPWGGGRVRKEWRVSLEEIHLALASLEETL